MNVRMLLVGGLLGFILMSGFMITSNVTGYVVAIGEQTESIEQTITTDSLVVLSIPEDLESFRVSGEYQGAGRVDLMLVGADESWHVGSYDSPKLVRNTTFLLKKGGTVVQLPDEGVITYQHIFDESCAATCSGSYQGPFYLQVEINEGSFELESVTYKARQAIAHETTPDKLPEQIEEQKPVLPPRENLASDCLVDTDCGSELMCHVGYCIAQSGHLNITDNDGNLVALFDKFGRVLLKGDLVQMSTSIPPANAFVIQNEEEPIAWVTRNGDLHIVGTVHEQVVSVPVVDGEHFVISDGEKAVCSVLGTTGDLFTINRIGVGALA